MMDLARRYMVGALQPRELRRHVIVMSVVFWGLIVCAWFSFPADHKYSIMTHTFSFLGSFEQKHNPEHWWIFSIAMVFWGLMILPLVRHIHRRFSVLNGWAAHPGAFLMGMGAAAISVVGVFPDAHGIVIGDWEWTDIHMKAAFTVFGGFIFGIIWHGVLLARAALAGRPFPGGYRRYIAPYALWLTVFVLALYHLIKWEFIYDEMKAAAVAAGTQIGSSWTMAMNTRYSFPLWEHMLIYTLYIFLIWFSLLMPEEQERNAGT